MKLIYLLLIISASFFACNNNNQNPTSTQQKNNKLPTDLINNPATASADSTKGKVKMPAFHFDVETHDFGTITEGERISYAFKFTNTGGADLLIREAHGSCGCTIPEYPKTPIPPGGQGVINVTFNSEGKNGMQHKEVTVVANTIPNTEVLVITGEVIDAPK
jgi:hypothetical protein